MIEAIYQIGKTLSEQSEPIDSLLKVSQLDSNIEDLTNTLVGIGLRYGKKGIYIFHLIKPLIYWLYDFIFQWSKNDPFLIVC